MSAPSRRMRLSNRDLTAACWGLAADLGVDAEGTLPDDYGELCALAFETLGRMRSMFDDVDAAARLYSMTTTSARPCFSC